MMAEETIDAAMNTETDEEKDGHLRRLSNGNSDDQIRVAKRESRYRSPSRGSCHDLCKQGFKSEPETKVRRSLVRRNSLDSTRKTPNTYEAINNEIPESSKKASISLRRQTSSPAQIKYAASERHSRVPNPKTSPLAATQRLRRRHSERIIPKNLKPLYVSSAGGSIGRKNSEKKVDKETGNSEIEKKKILGREMFSLSSMSSTKRNLSAQSHYVRLLKKLPPTLNCRKRLKEVEGRYPPSEYVRGNAPHVIGPQAGNQAVGLSKRGSSGSSQVSDDQGLGYGECTVKISHLPPTENTHTSLSSLESQSSISSSPEAMQSDDSAFDVDYNSESEYLTTELKVENTRTPRIQVRCLKNKDRPSSLKLQFRRGSVIDVQPEDTSPSRLKFRHQEALDADQNISDTECISLRRITSDGVLYETNSETEKVTLKHQDMEARGESWALVDDVIKETANRLVRSRKSKVKALVGAFEAVLCNPDSPRK